MKRSKLKIVLMGRKPGAVEAARYLMRQKADIRLIVAPKKEGSVPNLKKFALENKIPFCSDDKDIYKMIEKGKLKGIDLVISYLYWKRIRLPLIKLGKLGCINFHPAPLPECKGFAGYNTAILEGRKSFGASAHFIDSEQLDAGPIIKVSRFKMDPKKENAYLLEKRSQQVLVELFKKTMDDFFAGKRIKTKPNRGGHYLNFQDRENMKLIDPDKDSPEIIEKKIRAFFFPPYHGAMIDLGGKKFTLVSEEILKLIDELIKDSKTKK